MMVSLLEPAAKFSVASEGEKYVTLSSVPFRYAQMLKACQSTSRSPFETITKNEFKKHLEFRLGFILEKVLFSLQT